MESIMAINESAEAQRLLMENLGRAAVQCGSHGTHLALILVEVVRHGKFAPGERGTENETTFRELLRAVQTHCGRRNDCVLRLSHERIAAVCPDTHAAGASHIAARIREAAVFLPSRRGLPLSLAIGVAVAGPDSGENADDILLRARRTLTAARNQPASLLSIRGAGAPPQPRASLFTWMKEFFRAWQPSPERRLVP